MDTDLDTLLIALYVELDDQIIPLQGFARSGRGRPPAVTDAELVCLAVAQAHLGYVKERRWLRIAPVLVGHLFPRLLSQSEYNRRLRSLSSVMVAAMRWLAMIVPSSQDVARLIDGTKIICGMSRETAKRSDLFGYCGYGYDASHSTFFWGVKLLIEAAPDGLITGFGMSNPKLYGERETVLMMQQTPDNRMREGTTAVGDKGFHGRVFENELAGQGVTLIRPAIAEENDPGVFPGWLRQRVESIIWTLKDQLGIEHPAAHTPRGLFTRIVQRLLALNAAIWHNWNTNAPHKRSLITYDHPAQ